MINIAIVEDNLHHLMRLETILYDLSKEMHIKINIVSSASIEEYQAQLSEKTVYDLYFLDLEIDNNKNKGFELAKHIRSYNPYGTIVFITTLSEAMPLVFRNHVSALDFITKNNSESIFRERVKECLKYVLSKNQRQKVEEILSYSYQGRTGIHIPFSDILFIQTAPTSHKLILFGVNFRKEFYGTIADILKLDKTHCFQQVDRSTIINIDNVIEVNSREREVLFYEGTSCSISRLRIKALIEKLKEKEE